MSTRQPDGAPTNALHSAWHEASKEQPPANIDAAILTAARDATDGDASKMTSLPVHRPWYQAWQPLLAAAGVAGLAFVLVQSLPREIPSRESVNAPVAASPSSTANEPTAPAGAAVPATSLEQRQEHSSVRAQDTGAPQAKAAAPAPPTAAMQHAAAERTAAQPPPLADADAAAAADAAPPAPAPAAAAPAARAREDGAHGSLGALAETALAAKSTTTAISVQHIVDLHARGDLEAAADALRKLRAQTDHADEQLPEALRAWARTVQ